MVTIPVFGPIVPTVSPHPWLRTDDLATQVTRSPAVLPPTPLPPTTAPGSSQCLPSRLPVPLLALMAPGYAVPCLSYLTDISSPPSTPSHASPGPDHPQALSLFLYPISPALKTTTPSASSYKTSSIS